MSPNTNKDTQNTNNNPEQNLNQYSSLKELPQNKKDDGLKISR